VLNKGQFMERVGGGDIKNYFNECKTSSCLADLGKKAKANYVARGRIFSNRNNKLEIEIELYKTNYNTTGLEERLGRIGTVANNFEALFDYAKKNSADSIFGKVLIAAPQMPAAPVPIGSGVSNLQSSEGYKIDGIGNRYIVNITLDPPEADLSLGGEPVTCAKMPCKHTITEGNVPIRVTYEQYETKDTVVWVNQNNQNIKISLKPNFGILAVRPAFSDGVGSDSPWNLSLNNKNFSIFANRTFETRLMPNKYKGKLTHECYEEINFDIGTERGKSETFDMSNVIRPRFGGLILDAEQDGDPIAEPVFINGKRAGETPFSGSVPVCSEITIGSSREKVNVKLKYRETVNYTHRIRSYTGYSNYSSTPQVQQRPQSTERSTLLYGIGFMGNIYFLDEKIYEDETNEKSDRKSDSGPSIGLITGISFTDWIALYSEFYYTYRVFANKQCSEDCTRIEESALDIPLLIKLNFAEENLYYVEGGILFGIPLKTTIYSSEPYIERAKNDFGFILGIGMSLKHTIDLGFRCGMNTSGFTKDNNGSLLFVGFLLRIGGL
jgi:hypothetical protein